MNSDRKKLVIRIFSILLIILIIVKGLFSIHFIIDNASAEGPTEISGYISSDTVWTVENSPYIIIEDSIVEENVKLTIDPGVIVKFDPDKYLRIDGTLYAVGTESKMITFTSNLKSPGKGDWGRIDNEKTSKDSIIKYCRFEYAKNGIKCSESTISITNSIFYNNSIGISSYSCNSTIMDNEFISNNVGISGGKDIIDNVFIGNEACLKNCKNIRDNIIINNNRGIVYSNFIENNYILNNKAGIDCGQGEAQIYNNYIVNNSQYGIIIWDEDNENITNNIIANNEVGIRIEQSANSQIINNNITDNNIGIYTFQSVSSLDETIFELKNNNIQDNIEYNLQNNDDIKVIVPYNWWGTTDTSSIDSSIYDYHEDFEKGKVEYQPILESPMDVILRDMLPISELDLDQYDLDQYDLDESKEESDNDNEDFLRFEFVIAICVILIVLGLSFYIYRRKKRGV